MDSIVGGPDTTRALLDRAMLTFRNYGVTLHTPPIEEDVATVGRSFAERGFQYRQYDSYRYSRQDLTRAYESMSRSISGSGSLIRLGARVDRIDATAEGFSLTYAVDGEPVTATAAQVVLATGRSGDSLTSRLKQQFGLDGTPAKCDVGVRLEFGSGVWPDIDRYHNDLKLEFGDARTFCVCVQGTLAPYRLDDWFLMEGHSDPDERSALTNLGVVVRCARDGPALLKDIRSRVMAVSDGVPVRQSLRSFLQGDDNHIGAGRAPQSSIRFFRTARVLDCFPPDVGASVLAAVSHLAHGLLPADEWDNIGVFAPEIDYFWQSLPVTNHFSTPINGLFVVGDGTARFRGILQAFGSGLHVANVLAGVARAS
jgi:uncharacterized FAD-dependent dehydrogenase